MIIFFTIFLFLLIARANSYLLSYEILNIDESQMMANAVRFDLNKYNIFDFDGTSSGFLNSLGIKLAKHFWIRCNLFKYKINCNFYFINNLLFNIFVF